MAADLIEKVVVELLELLVVLLPRLRVEMLLEGPDFVVERGLRLLWLELRPLWVFVQVVVKL